MRRLVLTLVFVWLLAGCTTTQEATPTLPPPSPSLPSESFLSLHVLLESTLDHVASALQNNDLADARQSYAEASDAWSRVLDDVRHKSPYLFGEMEKAMNQIKHELVDLSTPDAGKVADFVGDMHDLAATFVPQEEPTLTPLPTLTGTP